MSKRIKKSFSSADQVLHLWANQSQEEAYCKNVFFKGNDVYSYGTHYLLGRLHKVKNKTVAVINSTKYSNTTAKHQRQAFDAVLHLPRLSSSDPTSIKTGLKETNAFLNGELEHIFKRRTFYAYGRKKPVRVEFKYLFGQIEKFNSVCTLLGAKKLKVKLDKALITKIDEHVKKCIKRTKELEALKNDPATIARKEKARLRKEALKLEQLAEKIAEWRNGGVISYKLRDLEPQLIRVRGNEVETTRGALVPLVAAKKLLNKILAGSAKRGDGVGSFTLDKIENGFIKIGCHTISITEAKNILGGSALKLVKE